MSYQLYPKNTQSRNSNYPKTNSDFVLFPFFSNKKKEEFYRELELLLQANIPLEKALLMIVHFQRKVSHQKFYKSILRLIQQGSPLFEALKAQKNCSTFEWSTIKVGEETGYLPSVLGHLSSFYKRKNEFRKTLNSALAYPFLLLLTAIIVVFFMLTTVVPLFQGIFERQGAELPVITQWVINFSNFMQNHFVQLILFILGTGFLLRYLIKIPALRIKLNIFLLKFPFLGKQIKLNYTYRFCQSMELLVKADMDLIKSFQLIQTMYSFYPLKYALIGIQAAIVKGETLSEAVKKANFFDQRMHTFIHVGEESHQLDKVFEELRAHYSFHISNLYKRFSALLEPMIILFVGILMGVILIGMYLPMFQLSTQFGSIELQNQLHFDFISLFTRVLF